MSDIPKELSEKLANGQLILFIGAGVSRSFGLPSYSGLIGNIGQDLGFDAEIFQSYGDYLTLAEYYNLEVGGLGPLKEKLKNEWTKKIADVKKSAVHQSIVNLGCNLIYTTNFDSLLENAHRAFNVRYRAIRGAKDMANLIADRVQIVKFHGDLTSAGNLVFTESDYFNRLSFESPLDVKLKADMFGKSLLFIGYSMSDINIRFLLYKVQKAWEGEIKPHLRPKSFVFFDRPNLVQEKVLAARGIQAIVSNEANSTTGLINFLDELKALSKR